MTCCVCSVWGQIDDKISCCGSGGLYSHISVWFSCAVGLIRRSQWGHDPFSWPCVSVLFTAKILDEIAEHGIKIYQLPDADSDEDEEFKEQTRILKVREGHAADVERDPLLVRGQITPPPCLYFPNLKLPVQSEDPRTCIFFFPGQYSLCCDWLQPADRGEGKEDPWSSLPLGSGRSGEPRA